MTIKVIVTDMDGTFLDDAKQYDRARFMAQYQELKKRDIEFVVASGNQYYQLISFFPQLKDEISFVAENGALVFEHGKQLFHGELTRHESRIVIGELLKDKQLNFVACGLQSAYRRCAVQVLAEFTGPTDPAGYRSPSFCSRRHYEARHQRLWVYRPDHSRLT